MSPGLIILTLILVGFGAISGLQFWMQAQASAQKGKSAPSLPGPLGEAVQGDALLFFHSPSCGPCKAMHPRIASMAVDDDRIYSIDVTQQMNVSCDGHAHRDYHSWWQRAAEPRWGPIGGHVG